MLRNWTEISSDWRCHTWYLPVQRTFWGIKSFFLFLVEKNSISVFRTFSKDNGWCSQKKTFTCREHISGHGFEQTSTCRLFLNFKWRGFKCCSKISFFKFSFGCHARNFRTVFSKLSLTCLGELMWDIFWESWQIYILWDILRKNCCFFHQICFPRVGKKILGTFLKRLRKW